MFGIRKSFEEFGSMLKYDPSVLIDGETFDNGKVVLQFDDAWRSIYTTGLPIFRAKGIKVTTFANTYLINQGTEYGGDYPCTWAQLRELQAEGHDIQCHGYRGTPLATLTEEQIIAEIVDNTAGFIANGINSPTEIAYSTGSYNDLALNTIDAYRFTGRTTQNVGFVNRKSNKFELVEGTGLSGTIANMKADMDYAKAHNVAYILAGHMIGIANPLSVSVAILEEAIDYGLSIGLDFITTKDLRKLMFYNDIRLSRDCPDTQIDVISKHCLGVGYNTSIERSTDGVNYSEIATLDYPNTDYSDTGLSLDTNYFYRSRAFKGSTYYPYSRVSSVSTPVTMSIKARGNGSQVTVVQFKTTRAMTITLTGNARFYTDAAGTLGESTTFDIPYFTLTTLYIKCSSGTSTLTLPNNKLIWINQTAIPANAPSFAFDVSKFTLLKYLSLAGFNEITGSISNLTDLETIYLGDSNSISGSLTNLTKLTYIKLYGTNTVGGSITNLIDLTYIYVFSLTHTITGDITNLTKLTYIYLSLNSTITGSITNLLNLTYLELTGTTLSGSVTNLVLLTKLHIVGAGNTISGSITNLTLINTINVEGSNTLTGSVSNLTALISITAKGTNTISGDFGINNVANGITLLNLNPCAITEYTSGAVWSNGNITINPSVGYGLSSSEIDNMLIDMAASPTLISKTITLRGSNAARTSASDAAVATLTGAGRTNTLLLN